jgi:uncharacterized protein
MPRVIHFEIHADNTERAIEFYSGVFGWEIEKWEEPGEYWLVTTGEDSLPGINGAITPRNNGLSTVATIEVENIDEYVRRTKENGGQVLTEEMTIPGVGYLVYCKDTEGNVYGMMEPDEKAR